MSDSAGQHALVTGPITGRIPTPSPDIPHDFVDVTPDTLYFDDFAHVTAVAEAIEAEHVVRGTHPIQAECDHLNDVTQHPNGVDPDRIAAHQAAHDELRAKFGA